MTEEKKIIEKPFGEKDSGPHNLADYDETRKTFKWEDVHENFSWNETGKVNMAYECIDKHCENGGGDKVAMIYDDDERGVEKYTYEDMRKLTNKFANVLKNEGIQKGDRIFTFMPRAPECYIAILGILKAGAIPAPLFEAFMEGAVKDRIENAEGIMIVTTPELRPRVPVKDLPSLKHIMYALDEKNADNEKSDLDPELPDGVDAISYHDKMKDASEDFDIEWLELEDPLILHYTSGSTGKPKGVVHVQNAMIGHYQTGKWVLDMQDDDVYWCTADPGWVTGTSYGIFAPYLNHVTNVIKGGRFSVDAWYKCLQENKVTIWYSAPTAFRLLMAKGEGKEKEYDLSSVRHILSVGEPLNPEVIYWGLEHYGLPIHDTWWMTETGHQLICNYPTMAMKPGSMGKPIPGVDAAIVDDEGKEVKPLTMGNLVIKKGWPGMMRKIWKNPEKYASYFENEPWYLSGDSAYMDEEGYFFFEGRIDDVIKTSGERVGPFEVESALVEHPAVAEAGVIGKPDPIRGNIIKAFISLNDGYEESDELKKEIMDHVKTTLAAHAKPREIEVVDKLPKTRSGKIMRRVLKAKELGLPTGDLSTMADD
jgi:acetyl-CoA synthetase